MRENRELVKLFYVSNSAIHGLGLYARVNIAYGTYMGTYAGPDTETNDTHVLWVETDDGQWVGRDGKNLLRYMNHSNMPCAAFDGFDLYALRDIRPHEEITIDYGEETEF